MHLEPECVGCFFNQIMKILRLLKHNVSSIEILDVQRKLLEYLLTIDFNSLETPLIGKKAYEIIGNFLESSDPFCSLKEQTNDLMLQYYVELKDTVLNSDDPLFRAIIASAIANSIDFASQHEIELIDNLKEFIPERLVINDYLKFIEDIQNTRLLLIIGDNSGEIVLDKLLIEIIKEKYPNLEIIYAVRSAPIINDVTIKDAKLIGLDKLVKVITSGPTPGVNLETATDNFKKYFFMKNTVILSKGQGNFESLYGIDLPDQDLYYLFMAKCNLMERILGAKIGQLIFMKKSLNF
jgi:uncharacterized protein with ATP-grasp and redox domains